MLGSKLNKQLVPMWGVFVLITWSSLFGDTQHLATARRTGVPEAATPANIIRYIRDRFEFPETVSVDAEPVRRSPFPRFYQTVVTVNDGKQKLVNDVFITNDARCLVFGNIFALSGATKAEIVRCVRDAAKLPATAEITISPFASTAFPDFLKSTVTVRDGKKVESGELFVTRDHRIGILGLVLPFRRDFVEQLIDTRNQPGAGPANARVTIVEYADLECPSCALFHKFLEGELLSKYGKRVRIVFKEFPLPMHQWSTTAAVANECAFQIDPAKFLSYRTLIFGSQTTINAANVRDRLLGMGEQVGLDRIKLSSCLDSEASLGRIEESRKEVVTLGINKTPTLFVNGRIVVGVPSPTTFYKIVDEAMATASNRP
jgi:protein-disulfide isomerase